MSLTRSLRWLILVVLSGLTACSSNYTIKTFDGDVPGSGVAQLNVAEDLELVALDGEPVESYVLDGLSIDYQVLPGVHAAVVRYSGVWANPNADRKEKEQRADRIKSHLLRVDFTAVAGEKYHFQYTTPESRTAAFDLQNSFHVTLMNSSSQMVASSTVFEPGSSTTTEKHAIAQADQTVKGSLQEQGGALVGGLVSGVQKVVRGNKEEKKIEYPKPSLAKAPAVETGSSAAAGGSVHPEMNKNSIPSAPAGLDRLDAMKLMWQQANKEEKKAFLRWAFH